MANYFSYFNTDEYKLLPEVTVLTMDYPEAFLWV
jgi:hypothetical protein